MQTEQRPRVALRLAHDHFRDPPKRKPKRARKAEPVAQERAVLDQQPVHEPEARVAPQAPTRPVAVSERPVIVERPAVSERPIGVERQAFAARQPTAERVAPPLARQADEPQLIFEDEPAATDLPPRPTSQQRLAETAAQARKLAGSAATKIARAASWTGGHSFRLATKAREWLTKGKADAQVDLDVVAEQSRFLVLPNRLASLADLSDAQLELVRSNTPKWQMHQSGSILVAEGEESPNPSFIVSGWACRTRVQDGEIHMLRVLLPGDVIGLFGHAGEVSNSAFTAMTTLETVSAQPLVDIATRADDDSTLKLAMQRYMAEEEAFLLNHALRLGMKSALARLAHFLQELHFRLMRVGLATASDMPFPLDRATVACAIGMTQTEVRRAAHALQARKIVRFGRNRAVIQREDQLRKLATFTPPAFSETKGRRLISDIYPDELLLRPQPWMEVATSPRPQPQEHVYTPRQQRPA